MLPRSGGGKHVTLCAGESRGELELRRKPLERESDDGFIKGSVQTGGCWCMCQFGTSHRPRIVGMGDKRGCDGGRSSCWSMPCPVKGWLAAACLVTVPTAQK